MHSRMVLTGVLAGALALAPGVAFADTDETVEQVNQAAADEQAAPAASNPDVSIPSAGTGLVTLGGFGSGGFGAEPPGVAVELPQLAIDLPARGLADQAGKTTVFEGDAAGVQVAVQPIAAGVRTAVQIDSPEAPERYRFAVGGDVVRLEAQPDGSVTGYDTEGEPIAYVAPAWARDASGRQVPTFYELEGTTLVQVVQHRGGDWAYPVTADPTLEFHWYWPHKARVWFSRRETERIYRYLYGPAAAGAAATSACGYIPVWYVKLACQAAVWTAIGDFTTNVTQAHQRRKCLTVDIKWFPHPWIDWQDRDGGRCRP